MTYSATANAVSDELRHDDDDDLAQAALELALQAWQVLAGDDPAWDRFGLELLDVRGRLHPIPTVVAVAAPPVADQPETRRAVASLMQALASRHERAATSPKLALTRRLELDAAAVQLRRAAAMLP